MFRTYHRSMRDEHERISKANPLQPGALVVEVPDSLLWREYLANHGDAETLIGTGIVRITAQFIVGTHDWNRDGQQRLDYVIEHSNGDYWRIHPGSKPSTDARPLLVSAQHSSQASVAQPSPDAASRWETFPAGGVWTVDLATGVKQTDRIGKAEAYETMRRICANAGQPVVDVTDGALF